MARHELASPLPLCPWTRDLFAEQPEDLPLWSGRPRCDAIDADECHTARERAVAGRSDVIPPCPIHPDHLED